MGVGGRVVKNERIVSTVRHGNNRRQKRLWWEIIGRGVEGRLVRRSRRGDSNSSIGTGDRKRPVTVVNQETEKFRCERSPYSYSG